MAIKREIYVIMICRNVLFLTFKREPWHLCITSFILRTGIKGDYFCSFETYSVQKLTPLHFVSEKRD